jgi:glyoxylase-like metal-dependent hydrolase (beta-lactamase superfamily II)
MKIRSITAPNPGPLTLDGTRTYLLGDAVMIDPGPEIESHIDAIITAQPAVKTILITHRHADHAPAAVAVKKKTGARIVAPRDVLDDSVVDERIAGAESIAVDGQRLEVIATPGHTAEHVCFLSPEGDLFSGDTILGAGTTAIFPPDGNMADYLRSLRLLRERSPRTIHPAHGPTRKEGVAVIDYYINHRLEREQQVLNALAKGPSAIGELRASIYPDLDARLRTTAETQMLAHLIKLEEEGRVEQEKGRFRLSR